MKSGGNTRLDRESHGCSSVLLYSSLFLTVDVWKQIASYGMKYYNNDQYPLPQTAIVAITESVKLLMFLVAVLVAGRFGNIRWSPWYAVPSLIYAFNNNVFFFALHYTTPPVWNILIQMRIILTALTYRFVFKRATSRVQWAGVVMLMTAIILTQFSQGQTVGPVQGWGGHRQLLIALGLATVGSVTSVIGTLTMEYLFKNDNQEFIEMQTQMYVYGAGASWALFAVQELTANGLRLDSLLAPAIPETAWWLLGASVVMSCISGITVALIIKKLDNIVKLYTQALSNLLTSMASSYFFPDHFHLGATFVGCLGLMLAAVYLYESKNISFDQNSWGDMIKVVRAINPRNRKRDTESPAPSDATELLSEKLLNGDALKSAADGDSGDESSHIIGRNRGVQSI